MILCKRESRNTILIMEMTGNGEQQCTWGQGKKALKRTRPKHHLKGHGNLVSLVLMLPLFCGATAVLQHLTPSGVDDLLLWSTQIPWGQCSHYSLRIFEKHNFTASVLKQWLIDYCAEPALGGWSLCT